MLRANCRRSPRAVRAIERPDIDLGEAMVQVSDLVGFAQDVVDCGVQFRVGAIGEGKDIVAPGRVLVYASRSAAARSLRSRRVSSFSRAQTCCYSRR